MPPDDPPPGDDPIVEEDTFLAKVTAFATSLHGALVACLAVLAVLTTITLAIIGALDDSIVVKPTKASSEGTDAGYPIDFISGKFAKSAADIYEDAQSLFAQNRFGVEKEVQDWEIPGTDISLQSLARSTADIFGFGPTQIDIRVDLQAQSPSDLGIAVYVQIDHTDDIKVGPVATWDELDGLIAKAAQQTVKKLDPLAFAMYTVRTAGLKKADRDLAKAIGEAWPGRSDRQSITICNIDLGTDGVAAAHRIEVERGCQSLEKAGDAMQEAEEIARRAVADNNTDDDAWAHNILGQIAAQRGAVSFASTSERTTRWNNAHHHFKRATVLKPRMSESHANLGRLIYQRCTHEENVSLLDLAIEHLSIAKDLDSENLQTRNVLTSVHIDRGDFDIAVEEATDALAARNATSRKTSIALLFSNRARAYAWLGKINLAIDDFKSAGAENAEIAAFSTEAITALEAGKHAAQTQTTAFVPTCTAEVL